MDRARFLLPLASRRVAMASTLAYNALRPARTRLSRSAIGVLAGATGLAGMPVLTVRVPAGVDPAEVLLTEHIAALYGCPLHAAIGIRPPDPHHKPTLQLFDDRGRPRGYAKIGWNDATRELVRAEAAALTGLPRAGNDLPAKPGLLHTLEWGDRSVTIVEPMPRGVRRLNRADVPRAAAMLAVARRGGPPAQPRPLAGSTFLAGLAERAGLSGRAGRAEGAIGRLVESLARQHGDTVIEFGDWHGDWVPWNLGTHRGQLFAWDWENSGSDVPVGFDLAHQAFQTALSPGRQTAHGSTEHMVALLERHGPELSLGPAQRRLVADAYLVELWLRTAQLAAGGAGWNPRLHPALLQILDQRLPTRHTTPAAP